MATKRPASTTKKGSSMWEFVAAVVGARVVEAGLRLGLELYDPDKIRRRGEARAEVRLRSAEVRRREALLDAQLRHEIHDIQTGRAKLTGGGRLALANKSHKAAEGSLLSDTGEKGMGAAGKLNEMLEKTKLVDQVERLWRLLALRSVMRLVEEEAEAIDRTAKGDGKIEQEFLFAWKEGAERCPDDDVMRRLWARLLLAEVDEPGSGSLRTMHTLRHMSIADAHLCAKVGPLAVDKSYIARDTDLLIEFKGPAYPKAFSGQDFLARAGLTYGNLAYLEDILLLSGLSAIGLFFQTSQGGQFNGEPAAAINFHHSALIVTLKADTLPLKFPGINITRVGRQILGLGDFESEESYVKMFADFIAKLNPGAIYLGRLATANDPSKMVGEPELIYLRPPIPE